MNSNQGIFKDNTEKNQFELHIDEKVARLEYVKRTDRIYLTHIEVPKALEGQGIAKSLTLQTLETVDQSGLKVIPQCPYVATFIKRHPEWERLVYHSNKE